MQKRRTRTPLLFAVAIFALLLLTCGLYGCLSAPATSHKVAYIPLDNRPVNQERVRYLAKGAGIELLMPEESLYRTALDPMQPNPDGSTLGNREALQKWLLEADKSCDYFIISLDQMTSGGLVGSRWLSNEDLTQEYDILDTVLNLCENNTVYLFDTVMRLASTVDYQGYTLQEYTALREYGMQARRTLEADDLTVDRIIANYTCAPDGAPIATDIPSAVLEQYLASRARKLKLIDYVLQKAGDKVDFFYIGVDDSSPENTIQTNEIQYITSQMGENRVLGAAADEMGACCLARMICRLYNVEVPLQVTYFGGGEKKPADSFDIGTLEESMQNHFDALSAKATPNTSNPLQVLCLTQGSNDADRAALLAKIKKNQAQHIPTVLIDVSEDPKLLSEMIMTDASVDICQLLGYSSWNTAANAIGLALSQGIARYAYLSAVDRVSPDANEGFLQALTFSYIKDISYKGFSPSLDGFLSNDDPCSATNILSRINIGKIITSFAPFAAKSHSRVSVSNFRYPWNRTFEMCFDIHIAAG